MKRVMTNGAQVLEVVGYDDDLADDDDSHDFLQLIWKYVRAPATQNGWASTSTRTRTGKKEKQKDRMLTTWQTLATQSQDV